MSELLPCPFCGGEAYSIELVDRFITKHAIECKECGAHTGYYWNAVEAINRWNTRAERTCYSERSDSWECSECGGVDAYSSAELINYCPNCGRKVEK